MNRIFILALSLLSSIIAQSASATVTIRVVNRPAATAFEILDNVSLWYPGFSYEQYADYWKANVEAHPDDAKLFAEYGAIRKKYFPPSSEKDPLKNPHGFFVDPTGADANPFSNAFYAEADLSAAFRRLEKTVVPWFNLYGRLLFPLVKPYVLAGKRMDDAFVSDAAKLCKEAFQVVDKLKAK